MCFDDIKYKNKQIGSEGNSLRLFSDDETSTPQLVKRVYRNMTPTFSIDEKIPSDVLDEITVADQMHVLSYFEGDDYTDEDITSLVNQASGYLFCSM